MRDPTNLESAGDDDVLKCLLSVLEQEETATGLPTPPDFLDEATTQLQPKSRTQVKSAGRHFRDGSHPTSGPTAGNRPFKARSSNGYDPSQRQAERETMASARGHIQSHQKFSRDFPKKMRSPTGFAEAAAPATGHNPSKGRANHWNKPVGAVNESTAIGPIFSQRRVNSNTAAGTIVGDDLHSSKDTGSPSSRRSGHLTNAGRNGSPDHETLTRAAKKEAGDVQRKLPPRQQRQQNRAGCLPNNNGPMNCQVGQVAKKRQPAKNTSSQPQHGDLLP